MVHHLDGKLPTGRANLYKRYVDGMLGIWDDRRHVKTVELQLTLEEKRYILRRIALMMFLEGKDVIEENVIIKWLNIFLEKNAGINSADVLAVLRERSGLLIGPGIYSFSHKSIAEYFVAETVFQGDQSDDQGERIDRLRLFENRENDVWNTVTFLWAGLAPVMDLESFIEGCIKENSISLATGLFIDQYDRFSLEIKRKIFQLVLMRSEPGIVGTDISWMWYGPVDLPYYIEDIGRLEIDFPSLNRRSITITDRFFDPQFFFSRAIEEEVMQVSLLPLYKGTPFFNLLLTLFIVKTKDLTDLVNLLNTKPVPRIQLESWYTLLIDYWLINETPDLLQAKIDIFKSTKPKYSGLIPLMLITRLEELLIMNVVEERVFGKILHILSICNILINNQGIKINDNLLQRTKGWTSLILERTHRRDAEQQFEIPKTGRIFFHGTDLLKRVISLLDALGEHEVFGTTQLFKDVKKYIEDLKEQRDLKA